MKNIGFTLLLLIIFKCSPQLVITSDKDSDVAFSMYKSYAWSDDMTYSMSKPQLFNDPQYDNELNRKRLKKAINLEMNNIGLMINDNDPDLLVDYHIVIKNKNNYAINTMGGHRFSDPDQLIVYSYDEGTLVIHLVDRKKNELVWQGSASRVLTRQYKDIENRINMVVSKIFKQYPSTSK